MQLFDYKTMQEHYQKVIDARLLAALSKGPRPIGVLASEARVSYRAARRHLEQLEAAGKVTSEALSERVRLYRLG